MIQGFGHNWLLITGNFGGGLAFSQLAILLEAARPRTREMCARELILFLGKDIPQSPPVNPNNFSKLFYEPIVKSLTDLQHFCSLLSADTSPYSIKIFKIPVPGYEFEQCKMLLFFQLD